MTTTFTCDNSRRFETTFKLETTEDGDAHFLEVGTASVLAICAELLSDSYLVEASFLEDKSKLKELTSVTADSAEILKLDVRTYKWLKFTRVGGSDGVNELILTVSLKDGALGNEATSPGGDGGTEFVGLLDQDGERIDIQNPLQVDGDSVHCADIDFDNSDFSGWTGDPELLFKSPFSASITNTSGDNPKQIIIAFKRTIKAQQVGLGENNGGDFSNTKISLLGSGGASRSIFDNILDSSKMTSQNAEFEDELFNSILIEFYTSDTVSLSNITIQKARYNSTQIQGKDANGNFQVAGVSNQGNLKVKLEEYQGDAFGRLRVSEPYTIFDSSLTNPEANNLFWSELTNGTGSGVYDRLQSRYVLSTAATGDYVVRQTKQRFKYQPGKSHEVLITGLFNSEAGQLKRVGLLDYDNVGLGTITNAPQNGVCFTNNEGVLSFCIYNNGVLTESVEQDNWNVDKLDGAGNSGMLLDEDSTNILFVDMEWLGVGAVRCGFVSPEGQIVVAHQFRHASNLFYDVYMRTANLPVSYAITSTNGAGSLKQICSSVISEGGFNPQGVTTAVQNTGTIDISNNATEVLVGLRLKEDSFEFTVDPKQLSLLSLANGNSLWKLVINPTYTQAVTWTDLPNSEVQWAENVNNNNLVTDEGIVLAAGSFSNNTDSLNEEISTALRIGKNLDGSRDELWLIVTALGNEDYRGTINFRQLI